MTLRVAIALVCLAFAGRATKADDLCGRPGGTPAQLFERLSNTEKLPEAFRDKSYVSLNDRTNGVMWTFTVAGHAAHPTVVCRRPVKEGSELTLQMNIVCSAPEAACLQLKRDFEALNARMIDEMKKQAR